MAIAPLPNPTITWFSFSSHAISIISFSSVSYFSWASYSFISRSNIYFARNSIEVGSNSPATSFSFFISSVKVLNVWTSMKVTRPLLKPIAATPGRFGLQRITVGGDSCYPISRLSIAFVLRSSIFSSPVCNKRRRRSVLTKDQSIWMITAFNVMLNLIVSDSTSQITSFLSWVA